MGEKTHLAGRALPRLLIAMLLVQLMTPATASILSSSGKLTGCAGVKPRPRGWTTIEPPKWPEEGNGVETYSRPFLSTFAVDPHDPQFVLISNGSFIFQSQAGGCGWRKVFELPDAPSTDGYSKEGATIWPIHVGRASQESSRVIYAVIGTGSIRCPVVGGYCGNGNESPEIFIARSTDSGESWEVLPGPTLSRVSSAYPPYSIAVAPSNPDVLYLSHNLWDTHHNWVDDVNELVGRKKKTKFTIIYASHDGGESWQQITDISTIAEDTSPPSGRLYVDPIDTKRLWIFPKYDEHVYTSVDGGKSFTEITSPSSSNRYRAMALVRDDKSSFNTKIAVVSASGEGPEIDISQDHGQRWQSLGSIVYPPKEKPGHWYVNGTYFGDPNHLLLIDDKHWDAGRIYSLNLKRRLIPRDITPRHEPHVRCWENSARHASIGSRSVFYLVCFDLKGPTDSWPDRFYLAAYSGKL
jgi:hypothetical protein